MIGLGLALVVIGGVVAAEIATSGGGQSSRPAPALPTQVLSGSRVDLTSLRGRPAVVNAYGLNGLPTPFVLDSRGRIVQKLQGPQTVPSLNQAVASAG